MYRAGTRVSLCVSRSALLGRFWRRSRGALGIGVVWPSFSFPAQQAGKDLLPHETSAGSLRSPLPPIGRGDRRSSPVQRKLAHEDRHGHLPADTRTRDALSGQGLRHDRQGLQRGVPGRGVQPRGRGGSARVLHDQPPLHAAARPGCLRGREEQRRRGDPHHARARDHRRPDPCGEASATACPATPRTSRPSSGKTPRCARCST